MTRLSSLAYVRFTVVILSIFLLSAQSSFGASQCKGYDPSNWTADNAREAKLCMQQLKGFTAKECDRDLCKEIETWRAKPRDEAVSDVSVVLNKVRDNTATLVKSGFTEASPLMIEIDRWLRDVAFAKPEDIRNTAQGPYRTKAVEVWAYNSASQILLEHQQNEINLGKIIDDACVSAARCEQALRNSSEIIVNATLVQIISGKLLDDLRQNTSAYVEMLNKRWENYFNTSRYQTPWELSINSQRFKTQGKAGFVSPPEDQIIILHPSPAVRYNSSTPSKFEPTLVLELAGYYRWKWEGSEPVGLVGGSLVTTWTGEDGERKPSWGAIAHFRNNYSIGFTSHQSANGHKISLLLSVDLGKFFQDNDALKKRLVHSLLD